MEFRTQVPIQPGGPMIDHGSSILLLGSCFVQNMGKKLEYYKFPNLLNPFGILFHPRSIHNFLKQVQAGKVYGEEDIFLHNETWHCFHAHSDLNSTERTLILERLNLAIGATRDHLKAATHVVLTPGTSWGYRYQPSGEIVANCHKIPQKQFVKELLDVEEDLFESVRVIKELNPAAAIIFTVSPVRHLKDGFLQNQQSKARLVTGVHKVVSEVPDTAYFPAYEIMMDELRDYRFYGEDMVHPNQVAIDYIWEKFVQAWISPEAKEVMNRIERIQKGLSHRPINEHSQAHKQFLKELERKKQSLANDYPQLRF